MKIEQRHLPALRELLRKLKDDENAARSVADANVANGKDTSGIVALLMKIQAQIEALEDIIEAMVEQGRIHVTPATIAIASIAYLLLWIATFIGFQILGGWR
jgi:hypothetical protein